LGDIIKLTIILVFLLGGTRRLNLGIILLACSVFLTILEPLPFKKILFVLFKGLFNPSTGNLLGILSLIMVLEYLMRKHCILQRMIYSLRHILKDFRVLSALFPALIGILPSAGGAIFSAPMVEEVSSNTTLQPERKSFINFWFRHPWEYFSPLYPAVIFASEILEIPISKIIAYHLPLGIITWLIGIPFAFWGAKPFDEKGAKKGKASDYRLTDIAAGVLPFFVILLVVALFHIPLILALLVAVGLFLIYFRYAPTQLPSLLRSAIAPSTLFLVIGLMIFKEALQTTQITKRLPDTLLKIGMPPILVVALVPFIVGVISGSIGGTIAITMPMLKEFIYHDMPLEIWAYSCCMVGCLISPAHLCLVLTVEYFKTNILQVLCWLLGPVALLLIFSLVWSRFSFLPL